jgi:hypothetical protein
LPLRVEPSEPIPDPLLKPGTPVPDYITSWHRPGD